VAGDGVVLSAEDDEDTAAVRPDVDSDPVRRLTFSLLEHLADIPVDDTSWKAGIKRFIARLCCVGFTLLIAEVVPNIQSLINVLGSFTMVIMVAMMPCVYYIRIQQFVLGSVKTYIKLHKIEFVIICIVLIWCIPMIVIGSIGAIEDFGES
ncbi:hypothetical protein FOZ62_032288, partial [Perkinsus olseni]